MDVMKELYEKVSKDAKLQEKFSAIMKDAETEEQEVREKLIAFAKDAGYDIKVEEMQAFFKDLAEKGGGELSDADLDMVAGGKATFGIAVSILGGLLSCGIASAIGEFGNKEELGGCAGFLSRDL